MSGWEGDEGDTRSRENAVSRRPNTVAMYFGVCAVDWETARAGGPVSVLDLVNPGFCEGLGLVVRDRYPVQDYSDNPLDEKLVMFCAPSGVEILHRGDDPERVKQVLCHSFTMTREDHTMTHATCLRFYDPVPNEITDQIVEPAFEHLFHQDSMKTEWAARQFEEHLRESEGSGEDMVTWFYFCLQFHQIQRQYSDNPVEQASALDHLLLALLKEDKRQGLINLVSEDYVEKLEEVVPKRVATHAAVQAQRAKGMGKEVETRAQGLVEETDALHLPPLIDTLTPPLSASTSDPSLPESGEKFASPSVDELEIEPAQASDKDTDSLPSLVSAEEESCVQARVEDKDEDPSQTVIIEAELEQREEAITTKLGNFAMSKKMNLTVDTSCLAPARLGGDSVAGDQPKIASGEKTIVSPATIGDISQWQAEQDLVSASGEGRSPMTTTEFLEQVPEHGPYSPCEVDAAERALDEDDPMQSCMEIWLAATQALREPFQEFSQKFTDAGLDIYETKCIILVSTWPMYTLFEAVLREVLRIVREKVALPVPLERCVMHLLREVPEPPPGRYRVRFKLHEEQERFFCISRPPLNRLPLLNVPLRPIFECLSANNLLTLFTAIILEYKVVFVSDRLDRLSTVTTGLLALLFPLTWQNPFIPILPPAMMGLVEAPLAVMVGIHRSQLLNYTDFRDSVVFVDLDQNVVEMPVNEREMPKLTSGIARLWNSLKRQVYDGDPRTPISKRDPRLSQTTRERRGSRRRRRTNDSSGFHGIGSISSPELDHATDFQEEDIKIDKSSVVDASAEIFNNAVRKSFLEFFVHLIGDYRKYMGGFESGLDELIDRDTFIQEHPESGSCASFLGQFVSTQMMQMFFEDRVFAAERNFEIMLFDAWIDLLGVSRSESHLLSPSESGAGGDSTSVSDARDQKQAIKASFLEDTSQADRQNFDVPTPSAEKEYTGGGPFKINSPWFPTKLSWHSLPAPKAAPSLMRVRRGSHLLRDANKVSHVLESLYLNFYTKQRLFRSRFVFVKRHAESGINDVSNLIQMLDKVSGELGGFGNLLARMASKAAGIYAPTNESGAGLEGQPSSVSSPTSPSVHIKPGARFDATFEPNPILRDNVWGALVRENDKLGHIFQTLAGNIENIVCAPNREKIREIRVEYKEYSKSEEMHANKITRIKAAMEKAKKRKEDATKEYQDVEALYAQQEGLLKEKNRERALAHQNDETRKYYEPDQPRQGHRDSTTSGLETSFDANRKDRDSLGLSSHSSFLDTHVSDRHDTFASPYSPKSVPSRMSFPIGSPKSELSTLSVRLSDHGALPRAFSNDSEEEWCSSMDFESMPGERMEPPPPLITSDYTLSGTGEENAEEPPPQELCDSDANNNNFLDTLTPQEPVIVHSSGHSLSIAPTKALEQLTPDNNRTTKASTSRRSSGFYSKGPSVREKLRRGSGAFNMFGAKLTDPTDVTRNDSDYSTRSPTHDDDNASQSQHSVPHPRLSQGNSGAHIQSGRHSAIEPVHSRRGVTYSQLKKIGERKVVASRNLSNARLEFAQEVAALERELQNFTVSNTEIIHNFHKRESERISGVQELLQNLINVLLLSFGEEKQTSGRKALIDVAERELSIAQAKLREYELEEQPDPGALKKAEDLKELAPWNLPRASCAPDDIVHELREVIEPKKRDEVLKKHFKQLESAFEKSLQWMKSLVVLYKSAHEFGDARLSAMLKMAHKLSEFSHNFEIGQISKRRKSLDSSTYPLEESTLQTALVKIKECFNTLGILMVKESDIVRDCLVHHTGTLSADLKEFLNNIEEDRSQAKRRLDTSVSASSKANISFINKRTQLEAVIVELSNSQTEYRDLTLQLQRGNSEGELDFDTTADAGAPKDRQSLDESSTSLQPSSASEVMDRRTSSDHHNFYTPHGLRGAVKSVLKASEKDIFLKAQKKQERLARKVSQLLPEVQELEQVRDEAFSAEEAAVVAYIETLESRLQYFKHKDRERTTATMKKIHELVGGYRESNVAMKQCIYERVIFVKYINASEDLRKHEDLDRRTRKYLHTALDPFGRQTIPEASFQSSDRHLGASGAQAAPGAPLGPIVLDTRQSKALEEQHQVQDLASRSRIESVTNGRSRISSIHSTTSEGEENRLSFSRDMTNDLGTILTRFNVVTFRLRSMQHHATGIADVHAKACKELEQLKLRMDDAPLQILKKRAALNPFDDLYLKTFIALDDEIRVLSTLVSTCRSLSSNVRIAKKTLKDKMRVHVKKKRKFDAELAIAQDTLAKAELESAINTKAAEVFENETHKSKTLDRASEKKLFELRDSKQRAEFKKKEAQNVYDSMVVVNKTCFSQLLQQMQNAYTESLLDCQVYLCKFVEEVQMELSKQSNRSPFLESAPKLLDTTEAPVFCEADVDAVLDLASMQIDGYFDDRFEKLMPFQLKSNSSIPALAKLLAHEDNNWGPGDTRPHKYLHVELVILHSKSVCESLLEIIPEQSNICDAMYSSYQELLTSYPILGLSAAELKRIRNSMKLDLPDEKKRLRHDHLVKLQTVKTRVADKLPRVQRKKRASDLASNSDMEATTTTEEKDVTETFHDMVRDPPSTPSTPSQRTSASSRFVRNKYSSEGPPASRFLSSFSINGVSLGAGLQRAKSAQHDAAALDPHSSAEIPISDDTKVIDASKWFSFKDCSSLQHMLRWEFSSLLNAAEIVGQNWQKHVTHMQQNKKSCNENVIFRLEKMVDSCQTTLDNVRVIRSKVKKEHNKQLSSLARVRTRVQEAKKHLEEVKTKSFRMNFLTLENGENRKHRKIASAERRYQAALQSELVAEEKYADFKRFYRHEAGRVMRIFDKLESSQYVALKEVYEILHGHRQTLAKELESFAHLSHEAVEQIDVHADVLSFIEANHHVTTTPPRPNTAPPVAHTID